MTAPGLWLLKAINFCGKAYDLRKLPHSDCYNYGFLPPRFFNQVLDAFAAW